MIQVLWLSTNLVPHVLRSLHDDKQGYDTVQKEAVGVEVVFHFLTQSQVEGDSEQDLVQLEMNPGHEQRQEQAEEGVDIFDQAGDEAIASLPFDQLMAGLSPHLWQRILNLLNDNLHAYRS